ncbi:MAG: hypothetical protein HY673_12070 [Chloroflexi bacterium]|nr:hypothetical protein [Chloroflexota bacterium]
MERQLERLREAEPQQDNYEFLLRWKMEQSRKRQGGTVLMKANSVPLQATRQVHVRMYTGPHNWGGLAVPGWVITRSWHVVEPGKHTHSGGGVLLYIREGRGYTMNNGVRLDWEKGDLELLPVARTENEHQHFNLNPGQPCGRVAVRFWPFMEAVAYETRQVENAAGWKGPVGQDLFRPADFVSPNALLEGPEVQPDGTLLDDLFVRRNRWREMMAKARWVVKAKDCVVEKNRMGLYRWYVHPSFTDVVCKHILFWTHEIPPGSRSGKQKHQGGRIHFVLQGRGYTMVDGQRYDWDEEDLLMLPINRGGVVFQHFNNNPGAPALMLVAEPNWSDILGMDLACGFEQLEASPDYR